MGRYRDLSDWQECDTARLWAKIQAGSESECWSWRASKAKCGYGQFMFGGRPWPAHRLVLWRSSGIAMPSSETYACHSCDNRECCNPSHLWWGTREENFTDMRRKGRGWVPPSSGLDAAHAALRQRYAQGCLPAGCRFSASEVRDIRRLWAAGTTQSAISRVYGVQPTTIQRIVVMKSYRMVQED